MNKGVRHFPPGQLDNTREGRTGNLHLLRGLLLIEAVEVRQPQGLQFVQRKDHFLQQADRNSGRLEVNDAWLDINMSEAAGSRHIFT